MFSASLSKSIAARSTARVGRRLSNAALAEIGGAWMIWQSAREHCGLAWIGAGIVVDGFEPDRYDFAGAAICLIGVAVFMFTPRVV